MSICSLILLLFLSEIREALVKLVFVCLREKKIAAAAAALPF